jgi:glutaredoxin
VTARPVVTLYGRPGCHLCDDARRLLDSLSKRLGFHIAEVNIESDDALLSRYLVEIPVVSLDGRELARAPISAVALEEALSEALAHA